jgi:hypothetical protein
MRSYALAIGVLLAALSGGSSLGCEGKNVIFEDEFTDDLGGWEADPSLKFGPTGGMVTLAQDWTSFRRMNQAFFAKNGDFCLEAAFPPEGNNNAALAIRFWVLDGENFYIFQVTQAGNASLWRQVAGKWNQIYQQPVKEIKTSPGSVNLIRAVAKGNLISTYVNGVKVRDARAQPPPEETRFGFYLQMDKAAAQPEERTFHIKRLKVTSVD